MFGVSRIRNTISKAFICRSISTSAIRSCEKPPPEENKVNNPKDRSRLIPVETSIRYLKSSAFKKTYGDQPVWTLYRRNFKGLFPPRKTRKTCIRAGKIFTGSPCPICRDEYLVQTSKSNDITVLVLTRNIFRYSTNRTWNF